MTRCLTKKKRNIKKYKKSRRGLRRGRISVKRHTVVKRRRMVGGADEFDFNVPPEDLKVAMSYYETYGSPFRQNYIQYVDGDEKIKNGFDRVELVAYGFALVTKTGTIFSGTNRKEQINVFACYLPLRVDPRIPIPNKVDTRDQNDPFCYAIVRCAKTICRDEGTRNRSKANYNMEDKILFLFISTNRNNINPLSSNVIQYENEKVKGIDYNVFEFTNKLSLDDENRYKILVDNLESQNSLKKFFEAVSKSTHENLSKGSTHFTRSISYPSSINFIRATLDLNNRDRHSGTSGLGNIPLLL